MNYFRYITRFISAYTIIVFTLQRLALVYSPFSHRFKTKRSAWLSVVSISICSLIINIWVPFLFRLESSAHNHLKYWSMEYFHITLVYICLIMALPILVILVSNFIIIKSLKKAESNRNKMIEYKKTTETVIRLSSFKSKCSRVQKPYYLNVEQIINRISNKSNYSKKLTRMFISFSFVLFNVPYLISWFICYYNTIFSWADETKQKQFNGRNLSPSFLKISEIFYLLNFSITFYIYFASGSVFREQLKYSGIF